GMAKAVGPGLPPPWNEAAALAGKLDAVEVTGDLRGKTLLSVRVDARDEASARKLHQVAQEGVELGKKLFPALQPLLSGPDVPRAARKALQPIADQLFTGLELKPSGKQVRLSLARPAPKAAGPAAAAFTPYVPKAEREEVPLGGEVAEA